MRAAPAALARRCLRSKRPKPRCHDRAEDHAEFALEITLTTVRDHGLVHRQCPRPLRCADERHRLVRQLYMQLRAGSSSLAFAAHIVRPGFEKSRETPPAHRHRARRQPVPLFAPRLRQSLNLARRRRPTQRVTARNLRLICSVPAFCVLATLSRVAMASSALSHLPPPIASAVPSDWLYITMQCITSGPIFKLGVGAIPRCR